jgi:TrmH family RNA methyltransferase
MITSNSNPRVKYVRRLQGERRFREREKQFVVEGTRWLAELANAGIAPTLVFATESWLNIPANAHLTRPYGAALEVVSDPVMAAASDTQAPPGVLAVVPRVERPLPNKPTLLLILDQLTNPGNLGTMLRTAAAAGVEGVLLGPGSVDATNPKVVRGAMGAHLRLPIHSPDWREIEALTGGLAIWIAAADGEVEYTAVDWRQPAALVVGSEAAGAGAEARQLARGGIHIPMHGGTESLNAAVAAGVILFEAVRQRRSGGRSAGG